MSSLVAAERRTFSALALLAAAVVALTLIAVTGTILLEPPAMPHPGTGHEAALEALVALVLRG